MAEELSYSLKMKRPTKDISYPGKPSMEGEWKWRVFRRVAHITSTSTLVVCPIPSTVVL